MFSGIIGMLIFLLCALLAKSFLEAINYVEHYGLVRERGKPVRMRHSWNSNHFFSSIYLYNVTRHSDHHKNINLKFWELKPIEKDAPMLPYGYLTMLYLVIFIPFLYKRIMKKELVNWDQNYANEFERNLVKNST
jgi:alkane 1-monooxygenase